MENSFEDTFLPVTSLGSGSTYQVAKDVFGFTIQIVNIGFIGDPKGSKEWVLIDAGMPHSADTIIKESEKLYGEENPPKAIVLTHGHFDHVGAIVELIENWQCPVYAHPLEIPYLTGKANYPKGDPTVDGGLVSELSPLFPNHGIQLYDHVQALPQDGSIPGLTGWRWIHTPGHTPGHISLFRNEDGVLMAGDAFVTVKQESLYKVFTQEMEISGPPKYFTTDWQAAWESVKQLEALKPKAALTGHGVPLMGQQLAQELHKLARNFDEIAIPDHGRFVPIS